MTAGLTVNRKGVGLPSTLLLFLLLGWAWYTWGALGALLFSFLVIMLVAWLFDRRNTRQYEDMTA